MGPVRVTNPVQSLVRPQYGRFWAATSCNIIVQHRKGADLPYMVRSPYFHVAIFGDDMESPTQFVLC